MPALSSIITFAVFQLAGCIKVIRAGLRCLISLSLMQSKPGAFLMSKLLMILFNSLILKWTLRDHEWTLMRSNLKDSG